MQVLIVESSGGVDRQEAVSVPDIAGITLHRASDYEHARHLTAHASIDLVLVDLLQNDTRALQLITDFRRSGLVVPVAVGSPDDMNFVRVVMKAGAYDYLNKRKIGAELQRLIENLRSNGDMRAPAVDEPEALTSLVGSSPAMMRLKQMIRRVADSDRPVLVIGPTGTGKELVVQSIHRLGGSVSEPLLDLNCGAIPGSLMESQLFGHQRGAFTGAQDSAEGYLTTVGSGTLFLDEIAELPLPLQAKLLRVLETRRFRAVGSITEQVFDGRVVAATHADLLQSQRDGLFREDLYYRLAVLMITVPPLDARREDIPALVEHFVRQQSTPLHFTAAATEHLMGLEWPGNVRQLRNAIDRIAVLTNDIVVTRADVEAVVGGTLYDAGAKLQDLAATVLSLDVEDKLEAAHGAIIDEALRVYRGNKSAAARALGVHRKVIERWVARVGPGAK